MADGDGRDGPVSGPSRRHRRLPARAAGAGSAASGRQASARPAAGAVGKAGCSAGPVRRNRAAGQAGSGAPVRLLLDSPP